ncbi:MAG: type II secretion system protein [Candidatus Omnitrophota bacterium]
MKNKKGFTYLELLAAIVITAIALIPIMRVMPEGMVAVTRVERLTRAGLLAQSKMDEVRSQILGTNASYGFSKDYTESATAFPAPDDDYIYTVTDDQSTDIKILNVTVWFDEDGDSVQDADEESVSLDVKVADRG